MEEWLHSLIPWGTEAILWAQAHSNETLNSIFQFFTFLGYEEFYLFLLPFVYWCLDRSIGIRLGAMALSSAWLNGLVKHLFTIPRPADPRIQIPLPETSPSFPSGHSQNAVANWGYLAVRFRNRLLWVAVLVVILGISLSRIVLGVHFPQDVIGGWTIGLIWLALWVWAEPGVLRWIAARPRALQLAMAVGAPLLLIFVHPADAAGRYPAEGSVVPMSTFLGLGVGAIMERAQVRFGVEGSWGRRALRFGVGLILVAVVYVLPKMLLPEAMPHGWETVTRIVRYGLLGWIVAFACPWLFVRLGLAGREE